MKRGSAYTFGVFDMLHIGHLNLFKNIKKEFDRLVVGVHNDEQVMTYKLKPITTYEHRLEIVKSIKYVDEIVENAPLVATDKLLDSLAVSCVVAGREKEEYISKYYQVSPSRLVLLARTPNVSTSELRVVLKE
jgi:glycerol-3-phosphate cytidylyltransferase